MWPFELVLKDYFAGVDIVSAEKGRSTCRVYDDLDIPTCVTVTLPQAWGVVGVKILLNIRHRPSEYMRPSCESRQDRAHDIWDRGFDHLLLAPLSASPAEALRSEGPA